MGLGGTRLGMQLPFKSLILFKSIKDLHGFFSCKSLMFFKNTRNFFPIKIFNTLFEIIGDHMIPYDGYYKFGKFDGIHVHKSPRGYTYTNPLNHHFFPVEKNMYKYFISRTSARTRQDVGGKIYTTCLCPSGQNDLTLL